jgi:hypothetical protein
MGPLRLKWREQHELVRKHLLRFGEYPATWAINLPASPILYALVSRRTHSDEPAPARESRVERVRAPR